MEEIVHEIYANSKLRITSIRITHRGEEPGLQPMVRVAFLSVEVVTTEQPFLRLDRSFFAMSVNSNFEGAMRHQVWDYYFCGWFWEG